MQTTGDLEYQRQVSSLHHSPTKETSVEEAALLWALRERLGWGWGQWEHWLYIRKYSMFAPQQFWGKNKCGVRWGATGRNKAVKRLFSLEK